MNAIKPIEGPAVWRGPDIQDSDEWIIHLNDSHSHELLVALAEIEEAEVDFLDVSRTNFVLPTVGPILETITDELDTGRGFVLVRGVPVENLTERQIELMYWGIGRYVGRALWQGTDGSDLFAHVRDEGVDRNANVGGGLLNRHTGGLPFHTDSSDIVGLLCIRPALSGGTSTIVSSAAVHNEILRTRPDLIELMYEQWWFDRKRGDGPDSFAQCPIYAANDDGRLFAFYGPDLYRTATRAEHVPELTDKHHEVLAVMEELNSSPEMRLDMNFQAGEIQFISNYAVMHSRTAYEDHPDPALKRDLIRLWLTLDRDLDIPESFEHRGLTDRKLAFTV